MDGVERLRRKRGDEEVTFGDVADHLDDFTACEPDSAEIVDALARFLASVEDTSHRHEGSASSVDPSTRVR